MFHVGHLNILRRARLMCDHLVSGVLADQTVLETKGRLPVVPQDERLAVVSSIRFVDEAFVSRYLGLRAWRTRPFSVMFKGSDWRGTERGRQWEDELAEVGVSICWLPYTPHVSTTLLRAKLRPPAAPPTTPESRSPHPG